MDGEFFRGLDRGDGQCRDEGARGAFAFLGQAVQGAFGADEGCGVELGPLVLVAL